FFPGLYPAPPDLHSFPTRRSSDLTFTNIGLESGVALNEQGGPQAGMGVGIGDYNLDGHLDIFKTHFSDDTNILYKYDGKGFFEEDRKSTRLNSSHLVISYAVFCLK